METVILLLRYDREGAVGLVINRPSEMKLSAVLRDIEGLEQRTDLLHFGGPVGMQQVFVLVKAQRLPDEATHVFDDVYVSVSSETLQALVRKHGERFKVYAGHAGWAPGQLDQELARGGWHVARAQASAIFDRPPAEVWKEFINWSETIEVRSNRSHPSGIALSLQGDSLSTERCCLHFAHVTY
jgi:putative transcriptional regulator